MIFLFATESEAQHFRAACPHATIVICGVGAAACAATTAEVILSLRARGERRRLILAGIAGSYSLQEVALCEVVEVAECQIEALPQRFAISYSSECITALRKVTLNTVNSSSEGHHKAQIEDMEGATFAAICQQLGVSHTQIRAISNRVGDPFPMWKFDDACAALAEALLRVVE